MSIVYPDRLSLAHAPTPIEPLDRFSERLGGVRLWVKRDDLTGAATTGNKVRKLEFVLAEALRRGADTIITCGGIQSNHCRATALACARLGLKCHLLLRGEPVNVPDGNLFLDYLAGATVTFHSAEDFRTRLDQIQQATADSYRRAGRTPFWVPMGASDEIGLWGYIAVCEEMKGQLEALGVRPQHIVSATGSGGTQAGLTIGTVAWGLGAQVWGVNVCDNEEYFVTKIRSDMARWREVYRRDIDVARLPVNVLDGYVGPGYAKATPEVFSLIRDLARTEGLVLDPVYTGKAFLGMLTELKKGRFAGATDILFLHTGGIYGLLAQGAEAGIMSDG